MRLIAYRQLTGSYGTVAAGKEFEADDDIALQLIEQGKAVKADPPRIEYEIKVIRPEETPEVSPREPFCHVPVPDMESPAVAPESAPSISAADLPERADASRRRRGRRPRSDS